MPRVKATPKKRPCPLPKEDIGSSQSQEALGSLLQDALKVSYGCLDRLKQEALLGTSIGSSSSHFDEKWLEEQCRESLEKMHTASYHGPKLPWLMSERMTPMWKEPGKDFD